MKNLILVISLLSSGAVLASAGPSKLMYYNDVPYVMAEAGGWPTPLNDAAFTIDVLQLDAQGKPTSYTFLDQDIHLRGTGNVADSNIKFEGKISHANSRTGLLGDSMAETVTEKITFKLSPDTNHLAYNNTDFRWYLNRVQSASCGRVGKQDSVSQKVQIKTFCIGDVVTFVKRGDSQPTTGSVTEILVFADPQIVNGPVDLAALKTGASRDQYVNYRDLTAADEQ